MCIRDRAGTWSRQVAQDYMTTILAQYNICLLYTSHRVIAEKLLDVAHVALGPVGDKHLVKGHLHAPVSYTHLDVYKRQVL